jgi:hypothetical protein
MICAETVIGFLLGVGAGALTTLVASAWLWRDRPSDVLALLDEDGES